MEDNRPKILLIYNTMSGVPAMDTDAVRAGLEKLGGEIDRYQIDDLSVVVDDIAVESYNLILFTPLSNALWNSGKKRAYLFEQLSKRSKPGALAMFICDISFGIDPYMWDEGETREDKRNVLGLVPIKVFVCLDKSIESNKEYMDRLYKIWLSKLHPESKLLFIEWTSFHIYNYQAPKKKPNLFGAFKRYKNMYYGIEKRKLKDSLISLGMDNKDSIVIGAASNMLPNCSVIESNNKMVWVDYIDRVDNVVVPYEPIKGDYQITLRYIEALKLYKDKVKLDDRIPANMQQYIYSEQAWYDKASETIEKIREQLVWD